MFQRIFKISLFIVAGIFILLLIIAGLTQTRRFKNWLRDEIVKQAASSINGTLSLGRIEGNLVSRLRFRELCIELEGDTLLYVPNVTLGLSPYELLKQQVMISRLAFESPKLSLRQRSDSTWNIAHLLKPTPPATPVARFAPTQKAASPWRIALQNMQIKNGTLILAPLDTTLAPLPRRVQNISTALRLDYAENQLELALRNFRFEALHPNFELDSLAAKIYWGADSLAIKDLRLRTGSSRFSGQLILRHLAQPVFMADLHGAPLHLDDLRKFYPKLSAAGSVQGSIHAIGDLQHVRTNFHLEHEHGRADGNFFVLRDSITTHYNLDAAVRALNLMAFLPDTALAGRLNFNLKLDGSGLTLQELDTKLVLAIDSSSVLGRDIAQLRLSAQARRQQIQAKLFVRSSIGELNLAGKLIDPLHRQNFELEAEMRHFNLAALLQNDTLDSDVSLRVAGKGKNFEASHLEFDGDLKILPSRLPAVLLDSAYCQFRLRGPDIRLDTLRMASSAGNVHAAGLFSLRYENNLHFRAELGNLAWVQSALEADTLRATGTISGSAHGPLDSLFVAGGFDLHKVQYNTTAVDRLTGTLNFHRRGDEGGGQVQIKSYGIVAGYLPIDSATAMVHYDLQQAQITADFRQGENNTGELEGLYTFGEIARFDVRKAEINVLGQTWRTPDDSAMWMDIGDEEYDFHNFILTSGSQRAYCEGRLSYVGEENLLFRIEGIDLATLASVLGRESLSSQEVFAGILEIEGRMTGEAQAPIIRGHFALDRGRIADFTFEKWAGEFDYADAQLSWQFTLHQTQDRRLTGEGYLPVNLALTNTGEVMYYDRPIRIQAATTGIDLAFLQTLTSRVKNVQGSVVFDIKLENTLQTPRSKGALRVLDGAFSIPEYGLNYNDVQLVMTIDTSFVEVNYFEVHSDKGVLEAGGQLNFTQEAIGDAYGFLKAENFLVTRKRELEVRINADIHVAGDVNGASYQGEAAVVRSRFFLPALQQSSVIQLEEKTATHPAVADCTQTAIAAPVDPMQRWLQNLQGELKINIPRNTWIRGPELNVEIEGALDFVQLGEMLSLFGAVNLVRGTYALYGKRFDIEKGYISFQGDVAASPQIELVAHHVFRRVTDQSERGEKQTLEVKITGDLAKPTISFALENEQLDEKDALAYLLFGVSFDQLRPGEREGLSQGIGTGEVLSSAAQGLVTGLVAKQLEQTLGRSLNLDVIEFQSGQDISQSAVIVGKYLTNDLFLSFTQDFSSPEGRTVSLEYEIAKFLFLQAAHGGEENKKTGFDLIWKWEW